MAKRSMRSLSDLPEGMITEILIRLPEKSVLICKSVCKPWLSTISNPGFVKYQIQHAMNNPNTLLVIKNYALGDEKRGTFTTLDMFPKVKSLVMPSMFSQFPVVGYSNGIVCLENISNYAIYLWNPTIRQYKKIDAPFRCRFNYKLGFGFDSISNDYKVFGIVYETWTAVIPLVFVYSANADSWRKFQDPVLEKLNPIYKDCHVVAKGVLYFYNRNELISFDLHKEVFGLVPFPSLDPRKMSHIFDYEGSVALFFHSDGNGGSDLWTLDDASHQVSWSKKCNINLMTEEYGCSIMPHCYLGEGQFWGLSLVDVNVPVEDSIFHYILYNSDKRKAKGYGLREEGVLATLQYTDTHVTFDGFQPLEENAN
ncbi:hypothetical protein ACET3Z_019235 [Daucus carota]